MTSNDVAFVVTVLCACTEHDNAEREVFGPFRSERQAIDWAFALTDDYAAARADRAVSPDGCGCQITVSITVDLVEPPFCLSEQESTR